jgi:hypothetical protein
MASGTTTETRRLALKPSPREGRRARSSAQRLLAVMGVLLLSDNVPVMVDPMTVIRALRR